MTYSLFDTKGRGDSGWMSMVLWRDDDGDMQYEQDARPQVGKAMRVGSTYARSYSAQDWWQTTPVVEILEDTPDKVVFKTRTGSTYTWKIL